MSPKITVGIIDNQDYARISATGNLIITSEDRVVLKGEKPVIRASVVDSYPLPSVFKVFVKEFKTRDEAEKFKREGCKNCGFQEVGKDLLNDGRVVFSNKSYWVFAGVFENFEDAEKEKLRLEREGFNPWIRKEFMGTPKGKISIELNDGQVFVLEPPVEIYPCDNDNFVVVYDVLIGIGYHWQHTQDLYFRGILRLLPGQRGKLVVVNELTIDEYLFSVNSSEMPNDAHIELLKAQTVAARGTVLATMKKHHYNDPFDICHDDHCQDYRGVGRERKNSIQAVFETEGEVLFYGDEICDTRFSKICGGIAESFEHVWGGESKPYLVAVADTLVDVEIPVNTEKKAKEFIDSNPPAYCNLNSFERVPEYLEFARPFFRWEVIYSSEELEKIFREKTGYDIGEIVDIVPLARGDSGRIKRLRIVGKKGEKIIDGELKIRQALHDTTLYSSMFYVVKEGKKFILRGGGWGHGVGMCQIGAAMMAEKGKKYDEILYHYYRGTRLRKVYEGLKKAPRAPENLPSKKIDWEG